MEPKPLARRRRPLGLNSNVNAVNAQRLRIAMDELQTVCNVTFVPRTGQPDYLHVQDSTGNSSIVGRNGGAQAVKLVSWSSRYVIIHELMHSLGVFHEQNRSDRDAYVVINQANIQPGAYDPNFIIFPGASPVGPYDFESIMHYSACAFSVCCPNGACACPSNCRSIDMQPPYAQFANVIGNRDYHSNGDKAGLANRYGLPVDDGQEENDSLSSPRLITPGSYSNLALWDADDYYAVNRNAPGPIAVTFSAPDVWSGSNVTVSILTSGGTTLASGAPADPDADGVFKVFLTSQVNPGTAIIRVARTQPWGGRYSLDVTASCVPEPWKQVNPAAGPSARVGMAMAYDAARNVTIAFGGLTAAGAVGDTWEWNGSAWRELAVTGPSPRFSTMMAYDSVRQRVVLFGGNSGSGVNQETWEWNGLTWIQAGPAVAPSSRGGGSMTYDSARSSIVLFGGYNAASASIGDTWEYDGTNWNQKSTAGPSARTATAMTFDPVRGRSVMFGGFSTQSAQQFAETWEWNGMVWSQIVTPGPSARDAARTAYDSARQRIVLYGGWNGSAELADTWEYSGGSWTQVPTVGPVARDAHAMVYDTARGRTVMFGGYLGAGPFAGDTWTYNGSAWLPTAGPQAPEPRSAHIMAFQPSNSVGFLFGGDNNSTRLDDTWVFNGANAWGRLSPANSPAPRSLSAAAWDVARDRMVVFGGIGNDGLRIGQTWEYSQTAGWTLRAPALSPAARDSAMMAYDSARGVCLLYGGTIGGANVFSDTWLWNGTNWTNPGATGPGQRRSGYLAFDYARQRAVLFGGYDGTDDLGDTWEWDGLAWTLRATTGPSPRRGGAMAYDPARGHCFIVGGRSGGTIVTDTWEWDGTSWTSVGAFQPGARIDASFGVGSPVKGAFLFGGYLANNTPAGDSWFFDSIADAPTFTAQPQNATVNSGTQAQFNAPATDAGNFTYRWYATTNNAGTQGSVALNDLDRGGRVQGTLSNQLRILNTQPSDATSQPVAGVFVNKYFCVATNVCQSATSSLATLTVNTQCVGDLNGDGQRNTADLTLLLGNFGLTMPPGTGGDQNGDGLVNTVDLTLLLGNFGVPC